MVGQSAVEGESVRQLAFDVLKLLSTDTERVQVTRNLIGRAHALQNHAARLVCVTRTTFRDDGSRLGEGLSNQQQSE